MSQADTPGAALLFELVRKGQTNAEVLQWLADGFTKYDRHDGSLPIERCLKLPSKKKRRREQRNYHLIRLAELIGNGSCGQRAAAVGREIDCFERGAWRTQRDRSAPPPDAGLLREHLFYLMRSLGGQPRPGDKAIELLLREQLEKLAGESSSQTAQTAGQAQPACQSNPTTEPS